MRKALSGQRRAQPAAVRAQRTMVARLVSPRSLGCETLPALPAKSCPARTREFFARGTSLGIFPVSCCSPCCARRLMRTRRRFTIRVFH